MNIKEPKTPLPAKYSENRPRRSGFLGLAGLHCPSILRGAELYYIGRHQLPDVESALGGVIRWIKAHPEATDEAP